MQIFPSWEKITILLGFDTHHSMHRIMHNLMFTHSHIHAHPHPQLRCICKVSVHMDCFCLGTTFVWNLPVCGGVWQVALWWQEREVRRHSLVSVGMVCSLLCFLQLGYVSSTFPLYQSFIHKHAADQNENREDKLNDKIAEQPPQH